MNARISANDNLTAMLEPDEGEKGKCCEYVLDKLCQEYECELIGRPYNVGGGYTAQDFLCRKNWRWYTIEFDNDEYKLYYYRQAKFFHKRLTPEMMRIQGYKTDEESLRAMGIEDKGGKIALRRRGNDM